MSYSGEISPGGSGFIKKERRGRRSELPDDVAKKLKSCSVMGCEEWRDLTSHTTYHCFPTGDKNQQRWEIWTSLLQKAREDPSWIPFRGSLVCSHHFRVQDFVQDPNQKRTKLVKNAIPSVFPTFTVDLDDPSFILDDSSEFDGDTNENNYYDETYDYSNQNSFDYEQDQDMDDNDAQIAIPLVQYDDDEDIDEPELQYVHQRPSNSRPPTLIPARNIPAGTSNISVRKSHEIFAMDEEPPRKRVLIGNSGGMKLPTKPSLTYQGPAKVDDQNHSSSKPVSNRSSNPISSKSKLREQLCKSNISTEGSSKLPFSWNPDLEIEVLEPSTDDYAFKQRIEELENEKEVLKLKYEAQIRALQRKVKEQDRIINEYAVQMNSLKRQRT